MYMVESEATRSESKADVAYRMLDEKPGLSMEHHKV